jgi:hypothetical protein
MDIPFRMLQCRIDWSAVGIWLGAGAEVLVALVILYEVEQHRRSSFLEEASRDEPFKGRKEIYAKFLETEDGLTIREKSEVFCRSLWDNDDLRTECDKQMVLFNRLGHLLTPRPISWIVSNDSILQWFPQSAVLLWLILSPYIDERRKRAGPWWAKQFEEFVLASVNFLLCNGAAPLEMYHPRKRDVRLDVGKEELREMQRKLKRAA